MYQVKKPKPRSFPRRSKLPQEQVSPSIPGRGPADDREQFLGKEFRVLDRYAMQDDLVETLSKTQHHKRLVHRVGSCCRVFKHKVCGKLHEWAAATKTCNCRLCPHDQRKRSLRLYHRWYEHIVGRENLRYIVFSERNSEDLKQGVKSLYAAWKRLRASTIWKRSSTGCIVALEITYNREERTWHPHINVLFEGEYIPFEALRQEWSEATRHQGQTSFITKADATTVPELLKYVTKLSDLIDNPVAVDEFLTATKRLRFLRTYGTFYGIPLEEEEYTEKCPDCGDDCVADVGFLHASQISLDFNGVFRIDKRKLRPSQLPSSEDVSVSWPRAPVARDSLYDSCRAIVARMVEANDKAERQQRECFRVA